MNIKQCEASGKSDHNHFEKPSLNESTLKFHVRCINVKKMTNDSHIFFDSTLL